MKGPRRTSSSGGHKKRTRRLRCVPSIGYARGYTTFPASLLASVAASSNSSLRVSLSSFLSLS